MFSGVSSKSKPGSQTTQNPMCRWHLSTNGPSSSDPLSFNMTTNDSFLASLGLCLSSSNKSRAKKREKNTPGFRVFFKCLLQVSLCSKNKSIYIVHSCIMQSSMGLERIHRISYESGSFMKSLIRFQFPPKRWTEELWKWASNRLIS